MNWWHYHFHIQKFTIVYSLVCLFHKKIDKIIIIIIIKNINGWCWWREKHDRYHIIIIIKLLRFTIDKTTERILKSDIHKQWKTTTTTKKKWWVLNQEKKGAVKNNQKKSNFPPQQKKTGQQENAHTHTQFFSPVLTNWILILH